MTAGLFMDVQREFRFYSGFFKISKGKEHLTLNSL